MSTRPRGRSACSRKPSERAFPPGTRGSPTRAGPRTARPTPSTRTRTPTVAAPWRWSTTASSRTPLLVGGGAGENFGASGASAVLSHTRSVVYLDDGEIAVVRPSDYRILDLDTVEKEKAVTRVDWDLATIERGGHAHFMLKEILEQPESLRNTLRGRLL